MCVVVGGPTEEYGNKIGRFWDDLYWVLERLDNRCRLCLMGSIMVGLGIELENIT